MGSPPFGTGKAAEGGSSWIVTEEQQASAPFIFNSGRTNQTNKKHVISRILLPGSPPVDYLEIKYCRYAHPKGGHFQGRFVQGTVGSCKGRFVQGTVGSCKGRFVQGTVGSCKN